MTLRPRLRSALIAAFILLNALDCVSTDKVLAHGGMEANPIEALSQASLGPAWWLPKLALVMVCAHVMRRWRPRYVSIAVAVMAVVVLNNFLTQ